MKRILRILFFLLLLAVAAMAGYFFLGEEEERDVYSFVPDDFIYLVESDRPVQDWKALSSSKSWQYLKGNSYFDDISGSADYLDSLLDNNQALTKLITLGDLLISAHITKRDAYEFVILVDMKGLGKLGKLGAGITAILEGQEYEVQTEDYFGTTIWNMKDPATGDVLSLTRLSNVLIASYDKTLLKKSFAQSEAADLREQSDFKLVQEAIARDESYSLYLNYNVLEPYLKLYLSETPELLQDIEDLVAYSAFDFTMEDEKTYLKGYTKQRDSVASFLNIFKDVGKGRMLADEVLPLNTAFFASINFDDFDDFYERFEEYYEENDSIGYADLAHNKARVEKLLKIDVKKDFFSWMTDEVVTAVIPTNKQDEYAYYAMLHFDDYEDAKAGMDRVAEQVRKRSPARFEVTQHLGVPIRYLELKGFFKFFFKKMFSRIEQPHYAFVGEYVVFSNDASSLEYLIDSYIGQQTLEYSSEWTDFKDNFERKGNMFAFVQNEYLYPYIRNQLDYETQVTLGKNKEYLQAFPRIGLQLFPEKGMYRTLMYAEFEKEEEGLTINN
ncbi:MAG: DUF3352 domain-containing protein [Bacteroidia bacterium]